MAESTDNPSLEQDAGRRQLYEQLFARIGEVSSLPSLATRIFEVAADPDTDAEDLLKIVEQDPALASRIVRTANSALYGLRRKVPDLWSCIMLLGFKEVRNLALTVFVAGLFRESGGHGTYSRQALWTHMISTGAVARFLCKRTRRRDAEDAYLAGLLHDVGLILIDQYMHKRFCQIVDQLSTDSPNDVGERKILGFDHTELGAHVAHRWRFPEPLVSAIRWHHAPEQYAGAGRELVCAVAVADYVCHSKGVSSLGVANARCPDEAVFAELGTSKDELAQIWNELDEVLASAQVMVLV